MATLDSLGQVKVPSIYNSLAAKGLGESLTIKRRDEVNVMGAPTVPVTDAYTGVKIPPITPVKQSRSGDQETRTDKKTTRGLYEVTLPTHQDGVRIDVNINTDYFVIDARGNEPAKTYRPIKIQDWSGVDFVVICNQE